MSLVDFASAAVSCADEMPLRFGLVARIVRGERSGKPEPEKPLACRCGAALALNDTLTRKYGEYQETFFWCGKCLAYFGPASGRRFGSVMR